MSSHVFRMATRSEPIAVIGVGLRLPGNLCSLDALWGALLAAKDLVGEFGADRFDVDRFVSRGATREGKAYTAAAGLLGGIFEFDAEYFGISPKEASRLDPQQRLLLECAVEALDDAGVDAEGLRGSDAAVIMGCASHDYLALQTRRRRTMTAYTMSGGASCNTANRISYVFDLHGPSFAVDTACSSSLTAVHEACEVLRSGRCAMALAGGVNVLLSPDSQVGFSQAPLLSPTGRSKPFSALADGFVRSEGAVVLLLKPLEAALADGDRVHTVILASDVNSDGRTQGLSLPNPESQADLIRRVHAASGIDPRRVAYVEAHGTGTKAGDPIECEALGSALGRHDGASALPVGSVKSNIGHLEAAAGAAGLLKAMLVLRERFIPATLHSEPVSQAIDFDGLGLTPVTKARPLETTGHEVAAVSSFGFGGSNAYVVLAPPPAAPLVPQAARRLPIVLSARSPEALTEAASRWAEHLEGTRPHDFYDLAFTSCRRRGWHEQRLAVLADDPSSAAAKLRALAGGNDSPGVASARAVERGRIGFVFTGNGAQWAGMGAQLLATDDAFRAEVEAVDEALLAFLGWSVRAEMTGAPDEQRMSRTEIAQPMLFAVQAGLVAALAARGVVPSAVTGHSVGEVAAAYCAGVLSRAEACRVIAERSRCQARTAGSGRMAAVGLSGAEARARAAAYGDRLVVSAVNSPRNVTVSGDADALAAFGAALQSDGVFFRDLGLNYAFHSKAMDPLQAPLREALNGLSTGDARIPLISTVIGGPLHGAPMDATYWWRNIREPVLFEQAIQTLVRGQGCEVLVEVGPHPALRGYLRETAGDRPVAVVATMTRTAADASAVDTAQAHVIAAGGDVDWKVAFPVAGRVVSLPRYPWQRVRHWNGSPDWWLEEAADQAPASRRHPLLGARRAGPDPAWQHPIEPGALTWLADHRVGASVVLPAAAYIDLALSSGEAVFDAPAEVLGLTFSRALDLPIDDPAMDVRLHTALSADGVFRVTTASGGQTTWTEHARGRVRRLLRDRPAALDISAIGARLPQTISADEHYAACARAGLAYGPAFRSFCHSRLGGDEILAEYSATSDLDDAHIAHPTLLDGALQATMPLVMAASGEPTTFLPESVEKVRCWEHLPAAGLVYVRARSLTRQEAVLDLTITRPDGVIVLELAGCRLRRFDAADSSAPAHLTEVLRAAPLPGALDAPSPLPSPAIIADRAAAELARLDADLQRYHYGKVQPRLLELAAHFTASAVRQILPGRDSFSLEELLAAGVDAKYTRLLQYLFGAAERRHVLAGTGPDRWKLTGQPEPERLAQALLLDFPEDLPDTLLFGVCGRHLPDVLRGAQNPIEMLFSEADSLAARLYDGMPMIRHLNRLARQLLRTAVAAWPADRPLRVLEVGAGTGGLTAFLLPELPADRTRYTFTDISSGFFVQAKTRFAAYDFVDYRLLDLEADPADQGFTAASFDLVIAANALHVTSDLAKTLRGIGSLLADGGHLLALEFHNFEFLAPTFGLLDSTWLAKDRDLRPEGLLLPYDRWAPLLAECGFDGTVQIGDTQEPGKSDVSVILTSRRARGDVASQVLPAPVAPIAPVAPVAPATPATPVAPARIVVFDAGPAHLREPLLTELKARTRGGAIHTMPITDDAGAWTTTLGADPGPLDLVLLFDSPEAASPAEATEEAVRQIGLLRDVVTGARSLPGQAEPTLWLVHAANGEGGDRSPVPSGTSSAVWGAARTAANENPDMAFRRITLLQSGRTGDETQALVRHIVAELQARPEDDEVLLTKAGRFVNRVRPAAPSSSPSAASPYVLTLRRPGRHYELEWCQASVPEPGPGEMVVEVRAASLNYRDILIAMGLIPAALQPDRRQPSTAGLGSDFAGTVTAVGPGVTRFAPGDRVAGVAMGCLGTHVVARADLAFTIPDGMTFAEAATVPVVFLTALHSLKHLARLAPGETVLVHGAAGGVGLATLQIAHHVGARVIATAGTPAKRDLLRLLGVEHVLDSRSLRFAEDLRDLTGGEGVDVVLNSLAGEGMIRSLQTLKPYGRFLELGKRDFLEDNALPLAPFLHNIAFFGVDLSAMIAAPASPLGARVDELREGLHAGLYRPLPLRRYAAAAIDEAFTSLRHSRHIGKIVVTFDEPVQVKRASSARPLDPEATYLITGGLGGFGAATARHLARRGARHLTLVSRRGRHAPEAPALLAELAEQGVQVSAHAADAADADAMRAILDGLGGRRLAGVVHGAMVLDDAPLTDLTDERLRTVLSPKVTAGLLLDALTRDRELDFFVVHSSVTALFGNQMQAAYVGANVALEAMIRARRRAGLPGLAVQWGGIEDTGYIFRTGIVREMAATGLGMMSSAEALSLLDQALDRPEAEVVAIGRFDLGATHGFLSNLSAPRTRELIVLRGKTDAVDRLRAQLAQAPADDAVRIATAALVEMLARVLQMAPDRIGHDKRLDQLGIDSLMGVELTAEVRRHFGCEIPVFELLGAADVSALARRILARLHPARA